MPVGGEAAPAPYEPGGVSRLLYWRLAGFYFFYFAYIGAFAPYFALYLESLGYTAALIGMVLAVPPAMRIFASYLWGALADRRSRRVGIACSAGLAGTAAYLGVFAGSEPAWIFGSIALWSFFWSAALPLMETTTLGHLRGRTGDYGRIRLWGSIGFIAAVVGVGWLLDRVLMRRLAGASTIAGIVATIGLLFALVQIAGILWPQDQSYTVEYLFGGKTYSILNVNVKYHDTFALAVAIGVVLAAPGVGSGK